MLALFLIIFLLMVSFLTMLYTLGLSVDKYEVKVNYTRKIAHFSMFFFPIIFFEMLSIKSPHHRIIISLTSASFVFFLMTGIIRNKSKFLKVMFLSIDRPEDRPHTLWWLVSQTIVGYLFLGLFYIIFLRLEVPYELLYLTILVTTIGDGLAEPIGVRFGRHKYKTKGFFTKKSYVRSIEGSLTIYFTSIIIIFFFKRFLSLEQLICLLLIYPIIVSLVEAKSPHTWDTPFLFTSGNMCLLFIIEGLQ